MLTNEVVIEYRAAKTVTHTQKNKKKCNTTKSWQLYHKIVSAVNVNDEQQQQQQHQHGNNFFFFLIGLTNYAQTLRSYINKEWH